MREYQTGMREERVLSKVVCNGCGREIPLRGADYFHAEKTWGYFSEQDGRQDAFDLCEECYLKISLFSPNKKASIHPMNAKICCCYFSSILIRNPSVIFR